MGETVNTPEVEAIRAELRTVMEARKLTVAEVSKRSGVAHSTLAAWVAGTYAGNNARVSDDVQRWLRSLSEQAERRAATLALPSFVATATSTAFLGVLSHAQFVPDMVTIVGSAGVGKTSACEEYRRTHPNVWMVTGIPSAASTHSVLEMICAALGVTENAVNRRNNAIVRRMMGSGGLLVVDEAQHLTAQALDELRSLHDAAKVGLALVGNESVFARIDGGGRRGQFAQVFSRIGMRINRAKPLQKDVDALLDAAEIAGTQERKLLRVIASKPGALRGMSKTLRVAHMLAAEDGVPISEGHLTQAWARLSDEGRIVEGA